MFDLTLNISLSNVYQYHETCTNHCYHIPVSVLLQFEFR